MYKDAKEELKRLEEALLEEAGDDLEEVLETEEAEQVWEEDTQTDDTEENSMTVLLATVITLASCVLAVLIFWFIRYGRVFL